MAEGGSAGGLLMGAVANIAPDAFAGIVAAVPFVDALTTILDPSLPLTVIEWTSWGNPLDDPEVYAYMKSYTPYENVGRPRLSRHLGCHQLARHPRDVRRAGQVGRPARATATGKAPILLKTEMHAGHGGVSGRYASWKERAWGLAWIIDTANQA
ncbi:prolyl oligopeptidase family serine peptidase [Aeromicrobium sp. UC242_57]|uniref:prolyl oligopeptidase family serine peptidase n=1 Tax=Aeromicrobium sp. UC242_57 TaxID=3374624 RepID=UPI003795D31F